VRSVVAALALASVPGAAPPHAGPSVWTELEVARGRVRFSVMGEPEPLALCLGLAGELGADLDEERRARVVGEALALFERHAPVTVDGEESAPRIEGLVHHPRGPTESEPEYFQLDFAYACSGWPRRVTVRWDAFDAVHCMEEGYLPLLIQSADDVELVGPGPDEPEHTWHAPAERVRRERARGDAAGALAGGADPDRPRAAGASGNRFASRESAAKALSIAAHRVSISWMLGISAPPPIL